MRPLRLELKGFSAFRDTAVVDFDGVDLAALVGPTGAGKSSVLDAIAFALYGSVARYDDQRTIAPAIHQLANEARVCLDFAIGQERFVAVRVIRRQPRGGGAVTREVRLERVLDGHNEVLAATAAEMSEQVEKVVGLTFDQFNKTVILPQGEFAAFLHQKGAERQSLLRTLLDLGLYQRMGRVAGERRAEARTLRDAAAERLAQLPGPDQIAQAEARHAAFVELAGIVDDHLEITQAGQTELARLSGHLDALVAQRSALAAIVVPNGVAQLDARRAEAAEVLAGLRSRRQMLDVEHSGLEDRLGGLPAVDALRSSAEAHRALTDLAAEENSLASDMAAADDASVAADRAAAAAASTAAEARALWEQLDRVAGVGALRVSLRVGEPCPLCEQAVERLPDHDLDEELAGAFAAMETAVAAARDAAKAAQAAATVVALARQAAAANQSRLGEARGRTEAFPDAAALDAMLAEIDSLTARQRELGRERSQVTVAERSAEGELDLLERTEADARKDLVSVRDAVAVRTPPPPAARSLLADWADLAAWALAEVGVVDVESSEADAERGRLKAQVDSSLLAVGLACETAGVDAGGMELARLQRKVDATVAKAEADLDQLRRGATEREPLTTRVTELERIETTAVALGRHLSANGFERWLLASILSDLVERAGERLLALSGGRYELHLTDDADFEIVDRHNGDERRSVRTLSGGETFLASLSLALALADDIADLAAAGAPRLDSVFLDEGFGTLDAETLETVADAIDELGASGRMVCIVTHIRELAERMPVRFEVSSGPVSSSVERVEA